MAYSIEQILGYKNLIGIVQNPAGGVPMLLPPQFTRPGRGVQGKTATWVEVKGNRKTARLVHYGGPSVRRNLTGVAERSAVMIHSYEHINHDMSVLEQLRNMDNPMAQDMGRQTIAVETANFRQTFLNLRESALCSLLTLGAIYFDGSGNLLPSSSGAVVTVDFSVPAGHKDQLNYDGGGAMIAASWATASTDIPSHVDAIKIAAAKTTGYRIKHAFYGKNIPSYIAANEKVSTLLGNPANGALASALGQGSIANGFLDLQWHKMSEAFFEDSGGTNRSWFGGDTVVFTPEPSPDWFENIEGSYSIPRNLGGVSADANSAAADLESVRGMFSYAKITDDPVGIKHFGGDTFLPTLKVPTAIFIADVTP